MEGLIRALEAGEVPFKEAEAADGRVRAPQGAVPGRLPGPGPEARPSGGRAGRAPRARRDDRRAVGDPGVSAARKPRALKQGDLVGVAAPAGPVDEARLGRGVAELERLGFAVRVADGVLERKGFTAGSVENRLGQLHDLFADPAVAAVVCARGGAGTIHLLPGLDRDLLEANPKPLLGLQRRHAPAPGDGAARHHQPARADGGAGAGRRRHGVRHAQPVARAHRRGRAVRERAGRPPGAGRGPGRGRPARRLPLAAGGGGGHGLGAAERRRAHDPLRRGRGREAVPGRPDAAAAAGLGGAAGRDRGRLRGHEGLRPGLPRGLPAGGDPAGGARGLRGAGRPRPLERPHGRTPT